MPREEVIREVPMRRALLSRREDPLARPRKHIRRSMADAAEVAPLPSAVTQHVIEPSPIEGSVEAKPVTIGELGTITETLFSLIRNGHPLDTVIVIDADGHLTANLPA